MTADRVEIGIRRGPINYQELARSSGEISTILGRAQELTRNFGRPRVTTKDVFLVLLGDENSLTYRALDQLGGNAEKLRKDIEATQRKRENFYYQYKEGRVSRGLRRALRTAIGLAQRAGVEPNRIGEVHLINALLREDLLHIEGSGVRPWQLKAPINAISEGLI